MRKADEEAEIEAEAYAASDAALPAPGDSDDPLSEKLRSLLVEVEIRIGHGAESGGHLEFVRDSLREIVYPSFPTKVILDDFSRADHSGGSNWTLPVEQGAISSRCYPHEPDPANPRFCLRCKDPLPVF